MCESAQPGAGRLRRAVPWFCALALFAALFPLRALRAAEDEYQVQQLKPNVFVWIPDDVVDLDGDPQYSRASTVGFVITDEGVVVIGATNNPLHAREVLYEIRRRTDLPVTDVIDLDPDGDQVLGNEVFAEQRARIIATANAAVEIQSYEAQLAARRARESELRARLRGIHFALPTQTFDRQMALRPGGADIRVLRVDTSAAGEMGGDAVVFLPAEKVVFLGDLYDNGYVPAVGSRDIRRWIQTLSEIESWKADTFVAGHGLPGSRQDLEGFRQFLQWIVSEVQTRIQEGRSLKQVKSELLTASEFRLHAWENVPPLLAAVYRQLVQAPPSAHGGSSAKTSGAPAGIARP